MNKQTFVAWLLGRGYALVERTASEEVYEKGDTRYVARRQSLGVRSRIVGKRWSGLQTWRYSQRFINKDGRLDYVRGR